MQEWSRSEICRRFFQKAVQAQISGKALYKARLEVSGKERVIKMIPTFPQFKKVEITDREAVESYTLRYPLYSDLNFYSLWSWDTVDGRMVSELEGNLIVKFTDYKTQAPFFSFLGTTQSEKVASTLIEFAEAQGISPELRLVPKDSIIHIGPTFLVEEDPGNFDYIYLVPELAVLKSSRFKSPRQLANRFKREYPGAQFKILELNGQSSTEVVIPLLHDWKANKKSDGKEYEIPNEEIAIARILKSADHTNLFFASIFLKERLIGFSINEVMSNLYGIVHFEKADITYTGIYDFLIQKTACHLAKKDVLLWNWEQDLNIE